MAYNIRNSKNQSILTVADGTKDATTTSLSFIGKRYVDFGLEINTNFIKLLENFNNTIPPSNPIEGQLWYDSTPGIESLKVYNKSKGWRLLSFTTALNKSSIKENVSFSGLVDFSNDVSFNSVTTFTSPIFMNDTVTINKEINGTFSVTGSPTFTKTVTFNGNVVFNNTFSFVKPVTFDDNISFLKDISITGDASFTTASFSSTLTANSIIDGKSRINAQTLMLDRITWLPSTEASKMRLYSRYEGGNDANTILFLNFSKNDPFPTDIAKGVINQGGTYVNNSLIANGNASVDVYIRKFGTGSLKLDGTNSYITITDNTNYDFGTSDFTFDGWFYTTTNATEQVIISKGTAVTDEWAISILSNNSIQFSFNDGTNSITISGGRYDTYRWHHWAIERENDSNLTNSTISLYLDGNRVATITVANTTFNMNSITGNIDVGRRSYGTFEYFNGNMDEIRMVRGESKYKSGFDVRMVGAYTQTVPYFINDESKVPARIVYQYSYW